MNEADMICEDLDKAVRDVLIFFGADMTTDGCWRARIRTKHFRPSTDWNDATNALREVAGAMRARVLIEFDATGDRCWHVRRVACVTMNLERNEKRYDCDMPLGSDCSGPVAICRAVVKLADIEPEPEDA